MDISARDLLGGVLRRLWSSTKNLRRAFAVLDGDVGMVAVSFWDEGMMTNDFRRQPESIDSVWAILLFVQPTPTWTLDGAWAILLFEQPNC